MATVTTKTKTKTTAAKRSSMHGRKAVPLRRRKDDVALPRRRKGDAAVDRKPAGIGAYVNGLLIKGKSTEEILELVGKQFPDAHTSSSSVAWYRSKLKQEGKL